MSGATQSAVIVTISAAEEAVASHRARFDKAAGWGVPAHVTVLYPFMPPSDIDTDVIEAVAAAIASVPRFHATYGTTDWFGTNVLWLDPKPAAPFQGLIAAVADAFRPTGLTVASTQRSSHISPLVTTFRNPDSGRLKRNCFRVCPSARTSPPPRCGAAPTPPQVGVR